MAVLVLNTRTTILEIIILWFKNIRNGFIMEAVQAGFQKANSNNLPKIDAIMLGKFFALNSNFCSATLKNFKTSSSLSSSYGDNVMSYVQLKRDGKICTVNCKMCPDQEKFYTVSLVVDEEDDVVCSVQCHDCETSQGCKHAFAFLMWAHRRSEEPACTSVEYYWKETKPSTIDSSLKYITIKDLVKCSPSLPSDPQVYMEFLKEAKKKNLVDCGLLQYQSTSSLSETACASMHQLIFKYKELSCDLFLEKIVQTNVLLDKIEEETRERHKSMLWFELCYGRITASIAFGVSQCKTNDETLISIIMGEITPDTSTRKVGRKLKDSVRQTVALKLGKKINKCGLMLSQKYPMIAGSPYGICENGIVEIKCPTSEKTYNKFIKHGKVTKKYYTQMQLLMYLSGKKTGFFCIADYNYSHNKVVNILKIDFSHEFVTNLIENNLLKYWKTQVYPLLCQSVM